MTVRLIVKRGGPLRVEGDVELVDGQGRPVDRGERSVVLLCRCGASRCLPFCDGSHNRVGFECRKETEETPSHLSETP